MKEDALPPPLPPSSCRNAVWKVGVCRREFGHDGPHAGPGWTSSDGRPLLVGECNPWSDDPSDALLPWPRGASGNRLRLLLHLSDREYLSRFRRTDLCNGGWDLRRARRRAEDIARTEPNPVVLLGARVCAAFKMRFTPFERTGRYLVLPHPSGRSRGWSEPGAPARARAAIQALSEEK